MEATMIAFVDSVWATAGEIMAEIWPFLVIPMAVSFLYVFRDFLTGSDGGA